MPPLRELKMTEHLDDVWELCNNRMLLGAFRYELMEEKRRLWEKDRTVGYPYPQDAIVRIRMYQNSGNLEHLLDAINELGIEFKYPSHPSAHFSPTDDGHHIKKNQK